MKREFDLRLFLLRALLMVFCLLLSVVIWLFSMWLAAPQETRHYSAISVTVVGSGEEVATVSATFSGTKSTLYRYQMEGIVAQIDAAQPASTDDAFPVSFYCGDEKIEPVTPVAVTLTAE